MPQTFLADMVRLDAMSTPVIVEYSFEADSDDFMEVSIIGVWLKANENQADAPRIKWTLTEDEAWCAQLCEQHVDEPDVKG